MNSQQGSHALRKGQLICRSLWQQRPDACGPATCLVYHLPNQLISCERVAKAHQMDPIPWYIVLAAVLSGKSDLAQLRAT